MPAGLPISEDIACAGTQVERACALESMLTDNQSLSLGVESDDPDRDPAIAPAPYEFVQLDDGVFRAVYTVGDGSVNVSLSSTSPETALHGSSVNVEATGERPGTVGGAEGIEVTEVSDTVLEAAEHGQATSQERVAVPDKPVLVDDEYYRVYLAEKAQEGATTPLSLGIFFTGGLGAILLLSLARRFRVSYQPG